MRRTLLFVLAAASQGCAVEPAERREPLRVQSPITQGTPTTADPAVVGIVFGGAVKCSGTLVDPRVVLTAAHCIDEGLSVFFADELGDETPLRPVARAVRHPDYDPATLENDLGLLLLETRAPDGVPVVPMNEARLEGREAAVVRIVGFGWNKGATPSFGKRYSGTATIESIQPRLYDLAPAPASTCGGDSGGPGFLSIDGQEKLVGVTSAGDEDCMHTSRQIRVDAYLSTFITPFILGAREASIEAGQRCWYDGHCRSGECVRPTDVPSFRYCAPPCARDAECPNPMRCAAGRCMHPQPSPGALGAGCENSQECVTKLCATEASNLPKKCSLRCVENLIPCEKGFECRPINGAQNACFRKEEVFAGGGGCSLAPHESPWGGGLVALLALGGLRRVRCRGSSR